MAGYSTSNPPQLTNMGSINGDVGVRFWQYVSADSNATVAGAGYITNAKQLGMKVGDLVFVYDTANTINKMHQVLSFTSNAANLSAGTTIGAAS